MYKRFFKCFLYICLIISLLTINFACFSNTVKANEYIDFIWPDNDVKIYNASEQTYVPNTSKEHIELYYIESNRGEYIDTGIIANSIDKLEIDFSFEKNHLDCIFGVFSESEKNVLVQWLSDGQYVGYFGNPFWIDNLGDFSKKTNYIFDTVNKSASINGEPVSGTFDRSNLNLSFYLFAINYKGTVARQAKGRIYKAKIWSDGSLKRDLVPVITIDDLSSNRNNDGINDIPKNTVCFYDKTTDKYFVNRGSGNFVAGPVINTFGDGNKYGLLDYIQSNGSQYISTDMFPSGYEHFLIDFEPTENQGDNTWAVAGGRRQNITCDGYVIFGNAFGNTRLDCFGKNADISNTMPLSRHTIEYIFTDSNHVIKYDNNTYQIDGRSSVELPYNFTLFAANSSGTVSAGMKGRFYSFKEWDDSSNLDSSLIKHYIPVLRYSDSKPGMYDLCNDKFFVNKGSGEFTYEYSVDFYSLKDLNNDTYKATNVGDYNSVIELTDLGKQLFSSSNLSHSWKIEKNKFISPIHNYSGTYDGMEHTVFVDSIIRNQFGTDVTDKAIIKYSGDDGSSYNLEAPPKYKNIGNYIIYYQISDIDQNFETLTSTASIIISPVSKNIIMKKVKIPRTGIE